MAQVFVHTVLFEGYTRHHAYYRIVCSCHRAVTRGSKSDALAEFVEHLGYTAWPIV